MEIRKVGVVGAGVMGVGLGQSLAQTGHEAILVDVSDEVPAEELAGFDPHPDVRHDGDRRLGDRGLPDRC